MTTPHQVNQAAHRRIRAARPMNDPAQAIASLPAPAARMLAVEILLADPESLGDDCLESCLYIAREAEGSDWRKISCSCGSRSP
jgi:hypothetical protein